MSVAVGNFNGDNRTDLAVVNYGDNSVSVVLNGASTTRLPVGGAPTSVAIGDFNGDNKTDLAVANYGSNNVSILSGNGNGSFTLTETVSVGDRPGAYSVKVGDFNGDGKSDLAVAKLKSNEVSIVLGDGQGKFGSPTTTISLGPEIVASSDEATLLRQFTPLTVDDFNGDGRSDLAIVKSGSNQVSVLLNVSPRATLSITNTLPPPINTVPAAQAVNEDTQIAIAGISVSDLDGNLASTKLTVANGTLNVDVAGGAAILTGANNSSTLTLTGTQSQINTALSTLKYQGNLNSNGADTLTILSTDSSATPLSDTDTVSLTINSINDAPTDIALSATSVNENVPINTAIGTLTTVDPDNNSGFTYSFVTGTGDNDNSSFSINGDRLVINSSPDFEAKSSYSVRVRSTDAGGLFFDKVLVVTVNDLTNNNVVGSNGDDTLFATNEIDNIQALDGNDSIFATVANLQPSDVFDGGNGNDSFYLSGGIANQTLTVDLNSSNQLVSLVNPNVDNITLANVENIILTGFAGNASLNGNAANNILTGGIGNDTLNGAVGNDTLAGGDGNDSYYLYDAGDTIIENANGGTDTVLSNLTVNLLVDNVENIGLFGSAAINATGNSLDNTITGNSANNILNGGLGNDFLRGDLGNDSLIGGEGDDTLNGGAGIDRLEGGIGDDLYYISDADSGNGSDTIIENDNSGIDTAISSFTVTTLANNVEKLGLLGSAAINGTGNNLNNTITGNSANNILNGGLGNDFLIGGGGDDTLDGGAGDDTLAGSRGNDTYRVDSVGDAISEFSTIETEIDIVLASVSFTLNGNLENLTLTGSQAINGTGNNLNNVITGNGAANILDGGAGDDTLAGAAGIDTFILSKTGVDTIQDFAVGEKLLISSSAFGGLAPGVLANSRLLVGAGLTSANASDQRFIFNTTDKSLYFDVDGLNGLAATKIAVLAGTSISTLSSSSFSIV